MGKGKGGKGGSGGKKPQQPQQQKQQKQQKQQTHQPRKQKGNGNAALSICSRPIDLLLIFWFITFFCSTLLTDLHNFTASWMGIDINELEHMDIPWLPKFANWVYFRWGRTVDPVLLHNPMYWQAMEWVNILYLTPVAMLAVPALLFGWRSFKNIFIVTASFTLYSLIICLATCVLGDDASRNPDGTAMITPDPTMFIGIYAPYLTLSLAVILRFWRNDPFNRGVPRGFHAFLVWTLCLGSIAVFIAYIGKWAVLHEAANLPEVFMQHVAPQLLRLP